MASTEQSTSTISFYCLHSKMVPSRKLLLCLLVGTLRTSKITGFTIPLKNTPLPAYTSIHSPWDSTIDFQRQKTTRLNVLLEVPDNFFTFTFPILGIILSISKGFGRLRMEERAWEQRVEEAREQRLREDPTLTEIELRRKEAALEWSAYGKPSMEVAEREKKSSGRRVKVMEREGTIDDKSGSRSGHRMSDEEISLFEMEYGVEYDPYYDDPYTEDELPEGPYSVDRRYQDRIYENGEIFYKDQESGMFYRQGAKPRSLSFWK